MPPPGGPGSTEIGLAGHTSAAPGRSTVENGLIIRLGLGLLEAGDQIGRLLLGELVNDVLAEALLHQRLDRLVVEPTGLPDPEDGFELIDCQRRVGLTDSDVLAIAVGACAPSGTTVAV